jgi:Winged helix DNA-binding domain
MATVDPRVTAFAFRRQALGGSAATAVDALDAAIAVYSANPTGPLSIRARAAGVTPDDVRALELDRRVVRMRAMRTSAFLVPLEHAAVVAAATAVPEARFAWLLRAAGIPDAGLPAVRTEVMRVAQAPATVAELRARLADDGVNEPWMRGAALGRVLSLLTGSGELVAIGQASLSSNALRYVAREAWFGPAAGGTSPSAEDARAWLADAYLRRFGPAREADFAWWSGIRRGEAAAAVARVPTVELDGGLLLREADVEAWERTQPLPDRVTLVPKWDAWTMGYPLEGRERFVDRDAHDRVFDGDGNGLAMVLVAGRAVGAWGHRGDGRTLEVDLDLFERPSPRLAEAVGAHLEGIAGFLGYAGLRVREVATVVPNRRRIRRPLEDR